MSSKQRVGIMIDTESLGLGPKSVMLQFAAVVFDRDDPETILREIEEYFPAQPQIKLGRTVEFSTILFWMQQPDAARTKMALNSGDDFDELAALFNSIGRKLTQVMEEYPDYEVFARGTQHDIPMIQSLFDDLGQPTPWHYDRISDLKTLMKEAKVGKREVPVRAGLIPHHALSDCKSQIDCLAYTWHKLSAQA